MLGKSHEIGTVCHSGNLTFRIQNFYDKTTQNLKLVILKTFKWSSFSLLKATKLVIVMSSFCNFSMNTKPGNTACPDWAPLGGSHCTCGRQVQCCVCRPAGGCSGGTVGSPHRELGGGAVHSCCQGGLLPWPAAGQEEARTLGVTSRTLGLTSRSHYLPYVGPEAGRGIPRNSSPVLSSTYDGKCLPNSRRCLRRW